MGWPSCQVGSPANFVTERWKVLEREEMFHRPISHIKMLPSATEVTEARFKRFLKDLEGYERKFIFERTLDSFLDLYSHWKRTHEESLKVRLVMLLFELHRLDPGFRCDLSFPDLPACEKSSSAT